MAKKKILKDNGKEILPITHESCVLDNNGVSIGSKIGNINELATDSRTDLVSAINDILQFINNDKQEMNDTKQQIIDLLISNGIEMNGNESWEDIIGKLNGSVGSGGLDIISATELPATGKENQICVITDNPVDRVLMSPVFTDITNDNEAILVKLSLDQTAAKIVYSDNNSTIYYYIENFAQNNTTLPSYIYTNGNWSQFTSNIIRLMKDGSVITEPFGGVEINSSYTSHMVLASDHLRLCPNSSYKCIWVSTKKSVDFTMYNKCVMKVYTTGTAYYCKLSVAMSTNVYSSAGSSLPSLSTIPYVSNGQTMTTKDPTEFTFDISSWTGEGYLLLSAYKSDTGFVYITDVYMY